MHINDLLKMASERKASDLHLKVGSHPVLRINGELIPLVETKRLMQEDTIAMAFSIMSNRQKQKFKDHFEIDIAYSVPGLGRFRVNVFQQRGTVGMVLRVIPAKILTFARLFDRRVATEPCGLAILRGTLVGIALLGVQTFLVWAGTTYVRMWLDSETHILEAGITLSSLWPSADALLCALFQTASVAPFLVFIGPVAMRFARRTGVAVFIAAALAAVATGGITMGVVKPYPWQLVLLGLDYVVLAWTFARFDVLTLIVTVFTFAFCWQMYPLLVIFEPAGAAQEWGAFILWGVFVLAAAAVAFQSSLRAGYRRLAEAFE